MSSVETMFRATKTKSVAIADESVVREFENQFDLRPGSYIEVDRGHGAKPERILFVDCCYYNARGGYTARVKTSRMNQSGHLGTRSLLLTIGANGKGLKCMQTYHVRRLPQTND